MPQKPNQHYITLKLKGNYDDFSDFYDENKKPIYENIVEVFKGFIGSRKQNLTLSIEAEIQGLEWDTEFKFNKKEPKVLINEVLPYFEKIEDYEKCMEIINLHKQLTNSKKSDNIISVS